jgi:hypothetical protein
MEMLTKPVNVNLQRSGIGCTADILLGIIAHKWHLTPLYEQNHHRKVIGPRTKDFRFNFRSKKEKEAEKYTDRVVSETTGSPVSTGRY